MSFHRYENEGTEKWCGLATGMVVELRVLGTLPSGFKHLGFFWLRRVSQCSPGCSVDQACLCFLCSGIKVMCDHHLAKRIFSKHALIYWVFLLCGHVTAHMRLENNRLTGLEAGVHLYSPPRAQALGNTAFLRYGQWTPQAHIWSHNQVLRHQAL